VLISEITTKQSTLQKKPSARDMHYAYFMRNFNIKSVNKNTCIQNRNPW